MSCSFFSIVTATDENLTTEATDGHGVYSTDGSLSTDFSDYNDSFFTTDATDGQGLIVFCCTLAATSL